MAKQIDGFEVKTMAKKELAAAYGISTKTLRQWIEKLKADEKKKLGNSGQLLKPAQVEILVNLWGAP